MAFLVRTVSIAAESERRRKANPRKAYPIDPRLIEVLTAQDGQILDMHSKPRLPWNSTGAAQVTYLPRNHLTGLSSDRNRS